jgi:outer membrane protein assembly factor BamB
MNPIHAVLILCLLALPGLSAAAENWPQFRGPRGDGTSRATTVPQRWSQTDNVRWKTALPGEGHSSPIVWGKAVFVTAAVEETGARLLLRLDADSGAVVWQRTVLTASRDPMHRENNLASSTPVTDGTFVFTSFQSGDRVDLRCFDFEGKQVWAAQPLQFEGEHGYSYSPVIYEDLLIFDCRQEGEAALLALDKSTGQIRWRAQPGRKRISHVTPLILEHAGRTHLIVCGSDEIRSYEPRTGKPIWWARGPSDVAVAGLTFGDGMVFATAGYPDRTRMAVRVDGTGDVTDTHVQWSMRRQVSYVPSPVFHGGHLYTVLDEGMLFCLNAQTGEVVWDHRLGGRHRSSLILTGGHIYATDDRGRTTVFAANAEAFREVAVNELNEFCYATPAIAGNRIFLRTGANLYCIAAE